MYAYIEHFTISGYLCRASPEDTSIGVRRPRVFLRYHRGPVTALEAQQPFGCVSTT